MVERQRKWAWRILLALYIGFIFSNSLTPAAESAAASGRILRLAHQFLSLMGIEAVWLTEHIIRKLAHFAEYAVMGILLEKNISLSEKRGEGREKISGAFPARAGELSFRLNAAFLIPFTDETFPLFTEGRSGQLSDVWLDMAGILAGVLIFRLWARCIFYHRRKG